MLNVAKEVATLQRMTVRELRIRYADVFGEETKAGNKPWLIKRIAWRLQSLEEGDLSERARQRAAELANDADVRLSPPKPKSASHSPASQTKTAALAVTGVTPPGGIRKGYRSFKVPTCCSRTRRRQESMRKNAPCSTPRTAGRCSATASGIGI